MKKDSSITFSKVYIYIISSWRKIAIISAVTMICFFLLGGYTGKDIKEFIKGSDKNIESNLNVKVALNNSDKEAYEAYKKYSDIYDQFILCNSQDRLMTTDENNYYCCNIQYRIFPENDGELIASVLRDKIVTKDEILGDFKCIDNVSYTVSEYIVLKICIYGQDEQEVDRITNQLNEFIINEVKEYEKKHSVISMELLLRENSISDPKILRGYKEEQRNTLWGLWSSREKAYESMPSNVKKYIDEMNQTEELVNDGLINTTDNEYDNISFKCRPIYLLVGFVIGFVISIVFEMFFCIYNEKLLFGDDFEEIFNLGVLGRVITEKKYKGLDKIILDRYRHKFSIGIEEEVICMIASGIKVNAKIANTNKIFVTGAHMTERENDIMKKVAEILKDSNITLVVGKTILYCPDALEQLSDIGSVVLVEKAKLSSYDEIKREIRRSVSMGVNVLGAVIVE